MEQVDIPHPKTVPGDIAWIVLAGGIITYDLLSVVTGKAETMSSAIWRSLAHPAKSPVAVTIWAGITWHLFLNKQARAAYRTYSPQLDVVKTKILNHKGN